MRIYESRIIRGLFWVDLLIRLHSIQKYAHSKKKKKGGPSLIFVDKFWNYIL